MQTLLDARELAYEKRLAAGAASDKAPNGLVGGGGDGGGLTEEVKKTQPRGYGQIKSDSGQLKQLLNHGDDIQQVVIDQALRGTINDPVLLVRCTRDGTAVGFP